ncbi:MAG: hypothetical protein ACJ76N_01035, partial [Thermoanaerobaculia bacterium]
MSEPSDYESFDLHIEKAGRGFRVIVSRSPAGEGRSVFHPPYSEDELQVILARLAAPHRDLHSAGSPRETVEAIGKKLFESLFHGRAGEL